jgi:hypothetical protein
MSGETIARRTARERRRDLTLASMPRGISKENRKLWIRMTDSQRALSILLARSRSRLTAAFRIAYKRDETDTRPTIYCQASRAAKNNKVAAMAEALIGTFDEQGLSSPAATRKLVLQKLTELGQDPGVPPSVQVQAVTWLGRANHVRLFSEGQQHQEASNRRHQGLSCPKPSTNCSLPQRVQQHRSSTSKLSPTP